MAMTNKMILLSLILGSTFNNSFGSHAKIKRLKAEDNLLSLPPCSDISSSRQTPSPVRAISPLGTLLLLPPCSSAAAVLRPTAVRPKRFLRQADLDKIKDYLTS